MKKLLVAFAPSTLDELQRILEHRCNCTQGGLSDSKAHDALREVQRARELYRGEAPGIRPLANGEKLLTASFIVEREEPV